MAYQLTKDLETGNALIDKEHRQLIDALNELLAACAKGQGRKEIAKTSQFLSDYTTKHFADEEKLQLQYRYPDYIQHKKYHEEFKLVVKELCNKLEQNGSSVQLVAELNTRLADWLMNHIKREDKKLAAFIREKKSPVVM